MLVWAQIESKIAWENLDSILEVKGLTGIAGGAHDLAASLGHPGEPDHKERIKVSEDRRFNYLYFTNEILLI